MVIFLLISHFCRPLERALYFWGQYPRVALASLASPWAKILPSALPTRRMLTTDLCSIYESGRTLPNMQIYPNGTLGFGLWTLDLEKLTNPYQALDGLD